MSNRQKTPEPELSPWHVRDLLNRNEYVVRVHDRASAREQLNTLQRRRHGLLVDLSFVQLERVG